MGILKEVVRLTQSRDIKQKKEDKIRIHPDVKDLLEKKKVFFNSNSYSKTVQECVVLIDIIENIVTICKDDVISQHLAINEIKDLFQLEKGKNEN